MRQEPRDDVRITDYVMDEMEEQERLEFEAAMADSPDLQRRVRELQETVSLLQKGIAAEQPVELGEFPLVAMENSPGAQTSETGAGVMAHGSVLSDSWGNLSVQAEHTRGIGPLRRREVDG